MKIQNSKQNKGFTLLEIIMAVLIVTIGMGGVFTVIQKSFSVMSLSASRLVAANLAQEGIEIVRNIRDTNWIEGEEWNKGIGSIGGPVYYQVQYDDDRDDMLGLAQCAAPCAYDDMVFLEIDAGNGFYSYGAGDETKFKRRVTISNELDGSKRITVEVIWKERGGKEYNYTIYHLLYDWK